MQSFIAATMRLLFFGIYYKRGLKRAGYVALYMHVSHYGPDFPYYNLTTPIWARWAAWLVWTCTLRQYPAEVNNYYNEIKKDNIKHSEKYNINLLLSSPLNLQTTFCTFNKLNVLYRFTLYKNDRCFLSLISCSVSTLYAPLFHCFTIPLEIDRLAFI